MENWKWKKRGFKYIKIVIYINISNYGYRSRYEPKSTNSIKARKYAQQNLQETLNDTPRLITNNNSNFYHDFVVIEPEKMEKLYLTILDHARIPGVFDYSSPQTYFAFLPDLDTEAYVEIGGNKHRKLAISDFSA